MAFTSFSASISDSGSSMVGLDWRRINWWVDGADRADYGLSKQAETVGIVKRDTETKRTAKNSCFQGEHRRDGIWFRVMSNYIVHSNETVIRWSGNNEERWHIGRQFTGKWTEILKVEVDVDINIDAENEEEASWPDPQPTSSSFLSVVTPTEWLMATTSSASHCSGSRGAEITSRCKIGVSSNREWSRSSGLLFFGKVRNEYVFYFHFWYFNEIR